MNFILEGKLCFTETISTILNSILEGKFKHTVMYTSSTIMNFILKGILCISETNRLFIITPLLKLNKNLYIYLDKDLKKILF